MRKQIEVICDYCGTVFYKALSEIKRSKNNKNYCSLSCCAKGANNLSNVNPENVYDISKHAWNKTDEFTQFRWYLKRCRQRKNKQFDLTLEDLQYVWEKQNGICPYTNIELKLKVHSDKALHAHDNPFEFASVDRIDSSKGYTKDNIEFISVGINYLKNNFTKEQTISFINTIKNG